jgi:hypothetical protein
MRMSEIVKTDARNVASCDLIVEGFRERVWMDRPAILLAENWSARARCFALPIADVRVQ